MIREIDLSSKEAYLAWVMEWKGAWKALVSEIRHHKRQRRENRNRARGLGERYASARDSRYRRMWFHDSEAKRLRAHARDMLELRRSGKEQSWALRCAEQEAAEAA